ncbi:MAG TPA: glycosyltransferase [Candidatus Paceibacterota bacterium]
MQKVLLDLSIVLPTYKEKENIAVFIPQIEEGFKDIAFEIIIVDDNSKDGTKELISNFNRQYGNIRLIERAGLLGIGSALRDGYNASKGKFILSSDADLSFDVKDMRSLFGKIQEGYDIVLGYKVEYRSDSQENQKKSFGAAVKNNVSELGNWLIRQMSGMGRIRNFNTNFRVIRRATWLSIKTNEDRNFFLFETIFKAQRGGGKITEIPVTFYNRKFGQSKLNFFKEAPKYFGKLMSYVFLKK